MSAAVAPCPLATSSSSCSLAASLAGRLPAVPSRPGSAYTGTLRASSMFTHIRQKIFHAFLSGNRAFRCTQNIRNFIRTWTGKNEGELCKGRLTAIRRQSHLGGTSMNEYSNNLLGYTLCLKKTPFHPCILNKLAKKTIVIIFGVQNPKEISHQKIVNSPT